MSTNSTDFTANEPSGSDGNRTLETLLNEHDVARITALSVASVRRWRLFRQGPKYLKIGAAVRYKPEDVSAWLESRPSGGGHAGVE
jgi:predicted DNA-binding transcriptional regulator AlpA